MSCPCFINYPDLAEDKVMQTTDTSYGSVSLSISQNTLIPLMGMSEKTTFIPEMTSCCSGKF